MDSQVDRLKDGNLNLDGSLFVLLGLDSWLFVWLVGWLVGYLDLSFVGWLALAFGAASTF